MITQFYINVVTDKPLGKNFLKEWYAYVKKNTPNNVVTIIQDKLKKIQMMHFTINGKHIYQIPLTRNLTEDEIKKIKGKWPNTDKMQFSGQKIKTVELNKKPIKQKENISSVIAEDKAKKEHNKWINKKVADGWRFGLSYSEEDKTHPCLKPWDELSEKYKDVVRRSLY